MATAAFATLTRPRRRDDAVEDTVELLRCADPDVRTCEPHLAGPRSGHDLDDSLAAEVTMILPRVAARPIGREPAPTGRHAARTEIDRPNRGDARWPAAQLLGRDVARGGRHHRRDEPADREHRLWPGESRPTAGP